MFENLGVALQITVVGMGLVFAAILVLWGLIALLVRATATVAAPEPEAALLPTVSPPPLSLQRRRAAAIAVALALAQRAQPKTKISPLASQPIHPWQAVLRSGQMERWERRGRLR